MSDEMVNAYIILIVISAGFAVSALIAKLIMFLLPGSTLNSLMYGKRAGVNDRYRRNIKVDKQVFKICKTACVVKIAPGASPYVKVHALIWQQKRPKIPRSRAT